MSDKEFVISDEHQSPFSVMTAVRRRGKTGLKTQGDATERMDKTIGRLIYCIKGSVSANNYISLENLHLFGPSFCLQYSLSKPSIATMHIEVITSNNLALRVTLSTLYDLEQPKFLGRSLRLPLPIAAGWVNVCFNLKEILQKYCHQESVGNIKLDFLYVKKIQICSNIFFRDIVAGSEPFSDIQKIKELAVIPQCYTLPWIFLESYCESNISKASSSPAVLVRSQTPIASQTPEKVSNEKPNSSPDKTQTPDAHFNFSSELKIEELKDRNEKSYLAGEKRQLFPFEKAEKSLSLERVFNVSSLIGYQGGPMVLLYNSSLLVYGCGYQLVLTKLKEEKENSLRGLWKAFPKTEENGLKFQQAFLKGHNGNISLLQACRSERYLASISFHPTRGSLIVIWDIEEGTRVASLQPYTVTVGFDKMNRVQILVWDIATLLSQKGIISFGDSSTVIGLVAKQISEYSILQIRCTPFTDHDFISCGRENIRLWRIKNQHLSGRPVLLNQYSRGQIFTEIAFDVQPNDQSNVAPQFVFASSASGIIIKFHYQTAQVLCAFQLHSAPIRCFGIWNGFAVTGADDSKLRIWPLSFNDFLLESRHEGPLSNIFCSGSKLCIGTSAGTLGILDVASHSYETVLRSHSKQILNMSSNCDCFELASVSMDNTIRVWNLNSNTQTVEFYCEADSPSVVVMLQKKMFCGFFSGSIRHFDVISAVSLMENRFHRTKIECISIVSENRYLAVLAANRCLSIHEMDSLSVLKSCQLESGPESTMFITPWQPKPIIVIGGSGLRTQAFSVPDLEQIPIITKDCERENPFSDSNAIWGQCCKYVYDNSVRHYLLLAFEKSVGVYGISTEDFDSCRRPVLRILEKSVKRLTNGSVQTAIFDNLNNFIVAILKQEQENLKKFNNSDFSYSLAFLGLNFHKNLFSSVISSPQVFSVETAVHHVACFPTFNKLVLSDFSGSISVWNYHLNSSYFSLNSSKDGNDKTIISTAEGVHHVTTHPVVGSSDVVDNTSNSTVSNVPDSAPLLNAFYDDSPSIPLGLGNDILKPEKNFRNNLLAEFADKESGNLVIDCGLHNNENEELVEEISPFHVNEIVSSLEKSSEALHSSNEDLIVSDIPVNIFSSAVPPTISVEANHDSKTRMIQFQSEEYYRYQMMSKMCDQGSTFSTGSPFTLFNPIASGFMVQRDGKLFLNSGQLIVLYDFWRNEQSILPIPASPVAETIKILKLSVSEDCRCLYVLVQIGFAEYILNCWLHDFRVQHFRFLPVTTGDSVLGLSPVGIEDLLILNRSITVNGPPKLSINLISGMATETPAVSVLRDHIPGNELIYFQSFSQTRVLIVCTNSVCMIGLLSDSLSFDPIWIEDLKRSQSFLGCVATLSTSKNSEMLLVALTSSGKLHMTEMQINSKPSFFSSKTVLPGINLTAHDRVRIQIANRNSDAYEIYAVVEEMLHTFSISTIRKGKCLQCNIHRHKQIRLDYFPAFFSLSVSPVSQVSSMLVCGSADGRLGFIPVRHIWSMDINNGVSILQIRSSVVRKLSSSLTSTSRYAVLALKNRLYCYNLDSTLKLPTLKFAASEVISSILSLSDSVFLIGLEGGVCVLFDFTQFAEIPLNFSPALASRTDYYSLCVIPTATSAFAFVTRTTIVVLRNNYLDDLSENWESREIYRSNSSDLIGAVSAGEHFIVAYSSKIISLIHCGPWEINPQLLSLNRLFALPLGINISEERNSSYFPLSESRLSVESEPILLTQLHVRDVAETVVTLIAVGSVEGNSQKYLFECMLQIESCSIDSQVQLLCSKRILIGTGLILFLDNIAVVVKNSYAYVLELSSSFSAFENEISFEDAASKRIHLNVQGQFNASICKSDSQYRLILQTVEPAELRIIPLF